MRIGVVKSCYVREIEQNVSLAERCNVSRKYVVSAELRQLVGRYRVVFVDDGKAVHLKQTVEGVDRRALTVGVGENVLGHKYLRDRVTVDREELVVDLHKLALSDRRHSLLDLGRIGDRAEAELCNARADRSRGDKYYLHTCIFKVGEHLYKRLYST